MEFKFRAIEEQAPTNIPRPSRISYFTEQALRAGYSAPELGRAAEFFRSPSDVREAIKRELEKERIREEIIADEIAGRRLVEDEVRRQMLLEREMALRRGERFSAFSGSASAVRLEPRLGYHARGGTGGFHMLPFQRKAEAP